MSEQQGSDPDQGAMKKFDKLKKCRDSKTCNHDVSEQFETNVSLPVTHLTVRRELDETMFKQQGSDPDQDAMQEFNKLKKCRDSKTCNYDASEYFEKEELRTRNEDLEMYNTSLTCDYDDVLEELRLKNRELKRVNERNCKLSRENDELDRLLNGSRDFPDSYVSDHYESDCYNYGSDY